MMTLFHGSPRVIQKPIYGFDNPHNDYGSGFYCTQEEEMAKEWTVSQQTDGFANQYRLDLEGLSVLRLTGGDYHILNWLCALLQNRTFYLDSNLAKQAYQYILEHFAVEYKDYDVVIGYRADDSYFSFAKAFLNNIISLEQLQKAMVLGHLGEQVVLMSPKAFEKLEFVGASFVQNDLYYPKRMARDNAAREESAKEKSRGLATDEHYILDIMRGGWTNDDERLQRVVLK